MTEEDIDELNKHRRELCDQLGALQDHVQTTREPHHSLITEILQRLRHLEAKLHSLMTSPVQPEDRKDKET